METTCAMCGKEFYILRPEMYTFHRRKTKKSTSKWFCCYSCMLKYDQKHCRGRRRVS